MDVEGWDRLGANRGTDLSCWLPTMDCSCGTAWHVSTRMRRSPNPTMLHRLRHATVDAFHSRPLGHLMSRKWTCDARNRTIFLRKCQDFAQGNPCLFSQALIYFCSKDFSSEDLCAGSSVVEQGPFKPKVAGPIPARRTNKKHQLHVGVFCFNVYCLS